MLLSIVNSFFVSKETFLRCFPRTIFRSPAYIQLVCDPSAQFFVSLTLNLCVSLSLTFVTANPVRERYPGRVGVSSQPLERCSLPLTALDSALRHKQLDSVAFFLNSQQGGEFLLEVCSCTNEVL